MVKKLLACVALALSLCGCATAVGRGYGVAWGHPYACTMLALGYASEQPILYADAPFDFVFDTVFLPVDLVIMPFKD